ncbi:MAG: response regulator, partial [Chitinispirillales bacterium]|nr:response regulator [Chitinispirillales bacterium]
RGAGTGLKLDEEPSAADGQPAAAAGLAAGESGKPADSGAPDADADDGDTFAVHGDENAEYEETIAVPLNMLADAAEAASDNEAGGAAAEVDDDAAAEVDGAAAEFNDAVAEEVDDAAAGADNAAAVTVGGAAVKTGSSADKDAGAAAHSPVAAPEQTSASPSGAIALSNSAPAPASLVAPPAAAPKSETLTHISMPKPTSPPLPRKTIVPIRRVPETVKMKERKVILAEDVEVNRELIAMYFEGTGVKFEFAVNGQEVCDKFESSPGAYSLILMDIQMPVMDGYEATRKIRSMDVAWAKQIPIIAMTGNDAKEDIDLCFDAGMDDHLFKPIDMPALQDKVFEIIASNTE